MIPTAGAGAGATETAAGVSRAGPPLPLYPSGPSGLDVVEPQTGLFVGGDGGLGTAAVLLSVCASAKRHGLNAWAYLRDLLDRLPARPAGADLSDLLPDAWAASHLGR